MQAIKKERPTNQPVSVFPSPTGICCMTQLTSHIYSIMKHDIFFKYNSKFQKIVSSCYARQANAYQTKFNRMHPEKRIWRHMLYQRTFYFSLNGRHICVAVELVRFRYVGTNATFTFYGTLFCAYSHFSTEFIKQAVSSSDELLSPSALTVSINTLNIWKKWIRNGHIFSHEQGKIP